MRALLAQVAVCEDRDSEHKPLFVRVTCLCTGFSSPIEMYLDHVFVCLGWTVRTSFYLMKRLGFVPLNLVFQESGQSVNRRRGRERWR